MQKDQHYWFSDQENYPLIMSDLEPDMRQKKACIEYRLQSHRETFIPGIGHLVELAIESPVKATGYCYDKELTDAVMGAVKQATNNRCRAEATVQYRGDKFHARVRVFAPLRHGRDSYESCVHDDNNVSATVQAYLNALNQMNRKYNID